MTARHATLTAALECWSCHHAWTASGTLENAHTRQICRSLEDIQCPACKALDATVLRLRFTSLPRQQETEHA